MTRIFEKVYPFFFAYARGTTTIPKINMFRQSNVMLNFLCIEKITTTAIPHKTLSTTEQREKNSRSSHNAIRHAQSLDRNACCSLGIIISYPDFFLQLLNFKFFKFHRNSNRALSHNHSSEDISIKKKFRGDNKMEVGKFSRVNGAWLKENVGNQVALVGKVVESDADTVKLTASVRLFNFVCV